MKSLEATTQSLKNDPWDGWKWTIKQKTYATKVYQTDIPESTSIPFFRPKQNEETSKGLVFLPLKAIFIPSNSPLSWTNVNHTIRSTFFCIRLLSPDIPWSLVDQLHKFYFACHRNLVAFSHHLPPFRYASSHFICTFIPRSSIVRISVFSVNNALFKLILPATHSNATWHNTP